jgi:hypothetical protein
MGLPSPFLFCTVLLYLAFGLCDGVSGAICFGWYISLPAVRRWLEPGEMRRLLAKGVLDFGPLDYREMGTNRCGNVFKFLCGGAHVCAASGYWNGGRLGL